MGWVQRRDDLTAIFQAALHRVDPYRMLVEHVHLVGDELRIELGARHVRVDLKRYRRIIAIGAGKATAPMALALEEIMGDRLDGGLIVVKYGHTEQLQKIHLLEAGHPVPDENGLMAARRIMALAEQSHEQTLVISLISGGGSALLPLPARAVVDGEEVAITLAEKQKTTGLLLACGADIEEINCIRKHLSMIKGGRLLSRLAPARSLNFILSDVMVIRCRASPRGQPAPTPLPSPMPLKLSRNMPLMSRFPRRFGAFSRRERGERFRRPSRRGARNWI